MALPNIPEGGLLTGFAIRRELGAGRTTCLSCCPLHASDDDAAPPLPPVRPDSVRGLNQAVIARFGLTGGSWAAVRPDSFRFAAAAATAFVFCLDLLRAFEKHVF